MSLRNAWVATLGAAGMGGILMLAMTSGGCTVSSGTLDGGSFDGSAVDTGTPTDTGTRQDTGTTTDSGVDPCSACLVAQCGAQLATCESDPNCLAIETCVANSGTISTACICPNADGQSKFLSLATCLQPAECGACMTACNVMATSCPGPTLNPFDCGMDAGMPDAPPPASTCTDCVNMHCSTEQAACGAGTDCEAYTACVNNCSDLACANMCATAHPSGQQAATALANCTTTNCAAQCM